MAQLRFFSVSRVAVGGFALAASLWVSAQVTGGTAGGVTTVGPSLGGSLSVTGGAASSTGMAGSTSLTGAGGEASGLNLPGLPNATNPGRGPGAQSAPDANRAAASEASEAPTRPNPSATRAQGPSQFQRFVAESTGRLLPIFGRDLFDSPAAFAADSHLPVPADYVLGPGDEIQLQVWGPIDFAQSLVLDRNGQVTLPKAGVVGMAGVPVRDIEKTLRTHLSKVYTNFQLTANMGRLRGIQIYVVGQAAQPGTLRVSALSTLVNALFASGGPSVNGSMRQIELKRAGRTVTMLDLYDFIAKGDKSKDVPLLPGDVIVIPPVGPRVAVTGALDQAAIYELKPGSANLQDVLALTGGVPVLATTQKALLERVTPQENPARQVSELSLNESGLKQPLRDGDVITLLGISPAFANAVTLQGAVAAPLRYKWFEGMRLLDLIPERDALITADYYRRKNLLVQNENVAERAGAGVASRIRAQADQINWEYAVIERLDRQTLKNELIPFHLGRAVLQRDPAQNLPLLPGDVVTVLSQTDLRVPQERQSRLVRVEGEVARPGVYQALPGETLPQLLQRVGGLTAQAYLFGTELSRESVRQRQQENLDAIIRRLEAQLQSQAATLAVNRAESDSAANALIAQQQQQALVRSQLNRLRALRSNGRLALELDTQISKATDLPALPLEDGDRVVVPAIPGFVAAYGSVNNENVLIHRAGRTVGDVIKSVGLTEDAEPDQAFVLRADGTVVSRRDAGGGFFSGGNGFEAIKLMPGDAVVVPAQLERETRYNFVTRAFKDWTQILANFGLGVAAIRSITKL